MKNIRVFQQKNCWIAIVQKNTYSSTGTSECPNLMLFPSFIFRGFISISIYIFRTSMQWVRWWLEAQQNELRTTNHTANRTNKTPARMHYGWVDWKSYA